MLPEIGQIYTNGASYVFVKRVYLLETRDHITGQFSKEYGVDFKFLGSDNETAFFYLKSFEQLKFRKV